jgi:preprotein translocase subunit SecD
LDLTIESIMPKQLAIFLGLTIASVSAILMVSIGSWKVASDMGSSLNQPTQVPSTTELERSPFVVRGGAQLVLQVNPTTDHPIVSKTDLEAVQQVIKSRIDSLGVKAPMVQLQGNDRLLVQLPGVKDASQAKRVLSRTAQLELREQKVGTETQLSTALTRLRELGRTKSDSRDVEKQLAVIDKLFDRAVLFGSHIKNATPESGFSNNWEVVIEFDQVGADIFTAITKRLAGTGRSIGVFLDNYLITNPTVGRQYTNNGITGGKASIGSQFTAEQASDLAIQLKSGALPLPLAVIESRVVLPK